MSLCRLANLCGLLSPVLWWPTMLTCQAALPAFDTVVMTISELAETGSPTAGVMFGAGFLATGLLNVGFGAGLYGMLGRTRAAALIGALLVVNGFARIGVGFSPCEPGCVATGASDVQARHFLFAALGFAAMIAASAAAAGVLRRRPVPRWLPPYTLLSMLLGAGFIVAMQATGEAWRAAGLLERLSSASLTLWMFVLALVLWRRNACARAPE